MQISERGIIAIVGHEGIVPAPYLDSKSIWTWGVGHTAAAGAPIPKSMTRGMPADLDAVLTEVFTVFAADLASYEAEVNEAVAADIKQHQFDALVSFHYNTGAIGRATLTQLLNKGDLDGAAKAFLNWRTPTEILSRRQAEQALFRDGTYPTTTLTVWQVSAAGKIIWTPARKLTVADAITMMRANWTDAAPAVDATEDTGAEETDSDTGLPILAKGSKGEHVRLAQTRLVGRGYILVIDGDFGAAMARVVKKFQRTNSLTADGRIGPLTWAALNLDQGA